MTRTLILAGLVFVFDGARVPGFLPAVPRAKYALMFGEFFYLAGRNQHSLMWIVFPPFDRRYYVFEQNRWGTLD